jgi:purine nucleosidase
MTARRLIIDCDPGKDDAVAIWLAAASPELAVDRVIAVGGNVGLARTSANARAVLDVIGRMTIPVFAGCDRPLMRVLETAPHVHGESGIDGAGLPAPTTPIAPGRGAVALVDAVMGADAPVTVAALGPLTNLAVAMTLEPALASRIERLVVMGGGFRKANMTPFAEFNIYVDPHAAAIVLNSGAPITLVPLDVTRQVLATPSWLDRLAAMPGPAPRATAGMYRISPDLALHDPCVVAWLLRPDLFAGRQIHVAVVTDDGPEIGRTLMQVGGEPTIDVLLEVDADGVRDLITRRIEQL